jgi:hypothetical protein
MITEKSLMPSLSPPVERVLQTAMPAEARRGGVVPSGCHKDSDCANNGSCVAGKCFFRIHPGAR